MTDFGKIISLEALTFCKSQSFDEMCAKCACNLFSYHTLGCPRMTQLLKCYAPDAFSGAKFQVFLENGHEIDVG